MLEKLFKLSSYFYKAAKIKEDMSLRIMHSLIPLFQSDPTLAREKAALLAPEIIRGANHLINYGKEIAIDEMKYAKSGRDNFFKMKAMETKEALLFGSKNFANDNLWMTSYGGKKWSDFCDRLLELYNLVEQFKQTDSQNILNKIIILMNVIDQMKHNTGSFYRNIYDLEEL